MVLASILAFSIFILMDSPKFVNKEFPISKSLHLLFRKLTNDNSIQRGTAQEAIRDVMLMKDNQVSNFGVEISSVSGDVNRRESRKKCIRPLPHSGSQSGQLSSHVENTMITEYHDEFGNSNDVIVPVNTIAVQFKSPKIRKVKKVADIAIDENPLVSMWKGVSQLFVKSYSIS